MRGSAIKTGESALSRTPQWVAAFTVRDSAGVRKGKKVVRAREPFAGRQAPSFLRSSAVTWAGFAWPWVAFMT